MKKPKYRNKILETRTRRGTNDLPGKIKTASEMLQAVMENLVKSGMRFNKWKNRNKSFLSSSKVIFSSSFLVQPKLKEKC
jgi:hypothetical protein